MKKTLTRSLLLLGAISLLSFPAFAEGEEGANSLAGALDRDHDGGVLENLGGFERAGAAEGSGEEAEEDGVVQERAYDPNANTASQPERNEGNEDDLDINDGDDGTGGGGASQGNGG